MKRAYIDVETTGLWAYKHGITQIAVILEMNDEIVERKDFKVRPFPQDEIDPRALEVQGRSEAEVMEYPAPLKVMDELSTLLGTYVNKYEKSDKFVFLAYNVKFDEEFMRKWFQKCGDRYFGSWFWTPPICIMQLLMHHLQDQRKDLPNFKLETVAKALGIDMRELEGEGWGTGAHDAMTDIYAAYLLYKQICQHTKWA